MPESVVGAGRVDRRIVEAVVIKMQEEVPLEFGPSTGLPDLCVGEISTPEGRITIGVAGRYSEVTIDVNSPLESDDAEELGAAVTNLIERNGTSAYVALTVDETRALVRMLDQAIEARARALEVYRSKNDPRNDDEATLAA
jgi:hypothetical protein